MNITIYHQAAHEELESKLEFAFSKASKVDISVAFITKYGFDFIDRCLKKYKPSSFRLVASIYYPTDLNRMVEFVEKYSDCAWIHLGSLTPQENNGDRYQLHSKLLRFEDNRGNVTIHIGSHNLTATAMNGINIEVGACIQCYKDDDPAIHTLQHIDNSIRKSEPFDVQRLDFYKTIQAVFRGRQAPSQVIHEFLYDDRLIILAEAGDDSILRLDELQLFFSPSGIQIASALRLTRKISLYLYQKGELFYGNKETSLSDYPVYFDGELTMVNNSSDAAVLSRPINSAIESLEHPVVISTEDIPPVSGNFQVVALLKNKGNVQLPVYHSGSAPKVKSQLDYSNRSRFLEMPYIKPSVREYLTNESVSGESLITKVPVGVESHVTLNIPNLDKPEIYPEHLLRQLEEIDFNILQQLRQRRIYNRLEKPKKEPWETDYFYQVSYSRIIE